MYKIIDLKTLTSTIEKIFSEFFCNILQLINIGKVKFPHGYAYPSSLRIGESTAHYIIEFVGSKEKWSGLNIPKSTEKVNNASLFINPGFIIDNENNAGWRIRFSDNVISNMTITTDTDLNLFKKKTNIDLKRVTVNFNEFKLPIIIYDSADKLILRNIDIIRADDYRVFYRTISTLLVVKKTITKNELESWLTKSINEFIKYPQPDILGLHIGYSSSTKTFAKELLNLTNQAVNESIIDKFINDHSEYFAKALGYEKALSQIKLKIIDKNEWDQDHIKPDYFMLKKDGYYDILDLKKALLNKRSVVKGKKSRIRFVDYVNELIAQLGGYNRYFKSDKNKEWAKTNYDIKVENPLLIGIVGDEFSAKKEEVNMVLGQYQDYITIMNYSTLINLIAGEKEI